MTGDCLPGEKVSDWISTVERDFSDYMTRASIDHKGRQLAVVVTLDDTTALAHQK
jgi:hypothetical protein